MAAWLEIHTDTMVSMGLCLRLLRSVFWNFDSSLAGLQLQFYNPICPINPV